GRALEEAGLSVLGVHCEIPVGDQQEAMLAMAEAYACDRMIWHGWPEDPRYGSMDGIKRLAEIYNEAHVFAASHGLRFGLHNHWWEFREVEEHYPFYLLMEWVEPDVFFEIDTYWTKVAGLDPARVVGDFGKRAPLLHIKDGPATSPDAPMVAAGQGVQDFPAIAKAADGATEWMIVELDSCETDMLEAVAQSYRYLTQNGLARGKL
ncbi:MAG: sugar phosphate isomerase/epimerase family protein, partial [Rhodothermales bacterium]